MRLPWVSRATLQTALADLDAWQKLAATRLERAEDCQDLLRDARALVVSKEAERAVWERLYTTATEHLQATLAARAEAEKRYETLALQVVELKRAEAGLPPMAFDASLLDPMNSLGPKTQLAIDDFAGGDPEMKKYLVGRAALEWSALAGQMSDVGEIDKTVAAMVRRGDGG